ncbi:polymerase [Aeromonas phage D3]|uniref:Uncharacterized protein n=2 Tax=Ludhianavirus TaxID=3044751 RepID=A0A514TVP9_9CAUD|nr:polymerase [Aeromonas phage LAh10]YP_010668585.1 polymerase [Aeromonas phage D3]QDH47036.1 putative RNA polymerase beta prime subunit [Aeromonas phage LAh10]QDJ97102.1 hypothetical protein D3_0104 [Aeromonas phage D3]QEP52408.1 hypothetical protein D9_0201 [Aeromonas phage D9]
MDPQLLKLSRNAFNQDLVDGIHMKQLNGSGLNYLEDCFRTILKPLAAKGYVFEGLERVDPIDFYNAITRPGSATGGGSSGTKEFEIAKNSFIGVRMKNHFIDPKTGQREALKEPLFFIAYTNRHGDVYTRNSLYGMQYVLAERGPSVDGAREKRVFVRVTGYKFNVTRELHTFSRLHLTERGLHSSSTNVTLPANRFYAAKQDRSLKNRKKVPIPLLSWYLFGKYGFSHCMSEFAECEYILDTTDSLVERCRGEDGWEIYENNGTVNPKVMPRPRGAERQEYEPAIAIRNKRGGEVSNLALQYVGGLLFMLSVFPYESDIGAIDEIDYWRYIVGRCSINLPANAKKDDYLCQMDEHFTSVEEYFDDHTLNRYASVGIQVKDTYEFLNYLMTDYSNLIKTYDPANMLHKELSSMEFLMDNMIEVANNFKYRIKNKANIAPRYINRELDTHFRLFNIDKSIRENNVCLEQTGTDNPFIDYGLGIILQTRASVGRAAGRKGDDFDPNHPGSVIHESQPFVCSYQCASKPSPDARGMLHPRVFLQGGKYTALRPEHRELYEHVRRRLNQRQHTNEAHNE